MYNRLNMSQQCILVSKKHHELYQEKKCQWVEGGDPFVLLSTGEATSGVQGPLLDIWNEPDWMTTGVNGQQLTWVCLGSCWAALCCMTSAAFRPELCCTKPMSAGQTEPPQHNKESCRQLLSDTSNYAACVDLPLTRRAARSCHVNILPVWYWKSLIELFSCEKRSVITRMTKKGEHLLWRAVCMMCCAWIRGQLDATPLGVPASEGT